MSDPFRHVPAGDHNPYEAVPWSRSPLEPYSDDTIALGATTSESFDEVEVEWRSDTAAQRTGLRLEGDAWVGEIGPVAGSGRYRFVGRRADAAAVTSAWYELEVPSWKAVDFTSIASDGDGLVAGGETGALRVRPRERSLAWALQVDAEAPRGESRAAIDGWRLEIEDGGRLRLSRDQLQLRIRADVAMVGPEVRAWRLHWDLDESECLLGTGERFDSLDQRGRRPDIRVYEQYKGQGSRTYFPVPWIASTRGYGLALDGAARTRFDLGASDAGVAKFTAPGAMVSGRWYAGSLPALVSAYTADLGARPTLPIWGYGPWMSGNEWNSQARVAEVVGRTLDEGIPASVLVIEAWADEATFYLWNDTEYAPVEGADPVPVEAMRHGGRWPDPKAMTDWLHGQGIRLVLWQIPVLKDMAEDDEMDSHHPQQTRDVAYADAAGLTVRAGDAPYRNRGWWFPSSRIIDFSNPAAREWWFAKRAYLLEEFGVDGFKTDGGEHLWGSDVVTHDGTTGDEAGNRFPTQYLEAYHRFLATDGRRDRLLFSRAGFTGSQLLPAHWAGDEDSTWEANRASLTAGLSAGVSGVAFWGWDIAGFSGPLPTSELYQRATAMAAFCPIMQYHSEYNGHRRPLADRTPWNVAEQTGDRRVLEVYRRYSRLRMNLVPYLFDQGVVAAQTGLPIMRAMALAFPADASASRLDDQYMLGSELLVAPVLEPGATERRVYLPSGEWFDFWTGELVDDGWRTVSAPLDRIPVFVRQGAVVPLWMPPDDVSLAARVGLPGDGDGRLVLMITPGERAGVITEPVTRERWPVEIRRDSTSVTVTAVDAPDGTAVWLRGPRTDRRAELADGSVTVAIG